MVKALRKDAPLSVTGTEVPFREFVPLNFIPALFRDCRSEARSLSVREPLPDTVILVEMVVRFLRLEA